MPSEAGCAESGMWAIGLGLAIFPVSGCRNKREQHVTCSGVMLVGPADAAAAAAAEGLRAGTGELGRSPNPRQALELTYACWTCVDCSRRCVSRPCRTGCHFLEPLCRLHAWCDDHPKSTVVCAVLFSVVLLYATRVRTEM